MRLFVALDLPETAKAELARFLDRCRRTAPERGLRWVRAENAHLTLRFLGETDPEAAPGLVEGLAAVATRHAAIDAGIGAVPGAFPPRGPARVVWLDVAPHEPIVALARDVAAACEARLGLAPEDRRFTPHLTLARANRPWRRTEFEAWRDRVATTDRIAVRFDRLVLVESRPGPGGSRYTEVATSALAEAGAPGK
jgi:2'-5' RNA ligase